MNCWEQNMIMNKTYPEPKDFEGDFPKTKFVIAIVGIPCPDGSIINPHWRIGQFFHIDEKYKVGFDGGINEHGVPYSCYRWIELEKTKNILGKNEKPIKDISK